MHDQSSKRAVRFSPLRLIARATAGMSRLAMTGLGLLAMLMLVPLVGTVADWMVKRGESSTGGVRPFQWVDSDALPPTCAGAACGMATLPLQAGQQVGGADSASVTVRLLWPAPMVVEAGPGTYLEAVGAFDGLHPLVQRPYDTPPADDLANDIRPLLLANEISKDGRSRPIMVSTEGFVSAWALDGDGAEQLIPWARPTAPDRNGHSQEAAAERERQWRGLRMRRIQFQPVPAVVEVDVLRAALLDPIPVGHVMAWEWQAGGLLDGGQSQLIPDRGAVGVVTQVQAMGQYMRLKVHIPRTSPYGSTHWLLHRLDGMPVGAPVLSNSVRAVFFKPDEMLGATPDWWQLERVFFKQPVVRVVRAPAAAFDPACAEPAGPSQSCVWIMLHGVAVPVQVSTQALPGGDMAITERAVFAGKALRAADWTALPREFRREYGSPSAQGAKLSRMLLDQATTPAVLAPHPWLKAGLPVSVAARTTGDAQ